MEGMNVQTAVLLAVIVVEHGLRRATVSCFSLKDDCCGGGAKDSSKKFRRSA